jgi:hypothetical protein
MKEQKEQTEMPLKGSFNLPATIRASVLSPKAVMRVTGEVHIRCQWTAKVGIELKSTFTSKEEAEAVIEKIKASTFIHAKHRWNYYAGVQLNAATFLEDEDVAEEVEY